MRSRDRSGVLLRSTLAASFSIAIAMLAVLMIGVWGAYRDLSDIRSTLLRAEVSRLRSHGIRTVSRLESELEAGVPLASLQGSSWLHRFWMRVIPREQQRLYAAVVDASGRIIMHSDTSMIGEKLEENWQDERVSKTNEIGDVFLTRSAGLSSGQSAFDIVIPIDVNDQTVGFYHSGFDRCWFDQHVAVRQRSTRDRWIVIIGSIFAVVLLAAISLHRINRRSAALQQAISMAQVKQFIDLGRLVGALAHEIRNPLNAIRLNLHSLRNVLLGKGTLTDAEVEQVVQESNREIERLSELMKTMLGYARPDQALVEEVDINSEIDSMTGFMAPIMERDGITFVVQLAKKPVLVAIDPDRLRQVLLNLINNAREAAGAGGSLSVTLDATNKHAEITVQDSGPGVPPADRDRIFEAFYSTRDTGTGLGLALVKRFVEEAGGTVACEHGDINAQECGAKFRIILPRLATADSREPNHESPLKNTTSSV